LFFWNSRPDGVCRVGRLHQSRFQSLFFWNSRPDRAARRGNPRPVRVSILVFLELAPGRNRGGLTRPASIQFQSLFFWNSRPDGGGMSSVHLSCLFQSLFFWNSRPDADFPVAAISPSLRFNPCFSGTRARTQGPPPRDRHI